MADRPIEAAAGPALLDATHWLLPLVNPIGLAATADGGATWHDLTASGVSGVAGSGWFIWIGGIDLTHAAALVAAGNSGPLVLYLTSDGGRSWHAADVSGVAADPVAVPFGRCPNPPPLTFDPDAGVNAVAAARAALPTLYRNIETAGYQVRAAGPATATSVAGYGAIAGTLCGQLARSRTYVVELYFPAMEPSASLSQGQLFASRLGVGWQVWYQYH